MAARHMQFVRNLPPDDPPVEAVRASREQQIAEAAYYLAVAREFEPGHELEDWAAAEREVDARLADEAHRR